MSSSGDEADAVFNISEDFVPVRQQKEAGSSDLEFDGLLKKPLIMHEDLAEGCGGMLWPAGMVLSKYILRQDKDFLRHKSMFVRLQLGIELYFD